MGLFDIFKKTNKYDFINNLKIKFPIGLSSKEIDEFSKISREKLESDLPIDFKEFLNYINGFSYNGVTIFSKFNENLKALYPRATEKTRDIICWNQNYYEMTDIKNFIILGKSDLDYIAYDKKKNKYLILTNGTMDEIRESEHFDELLKSYLKDIEIL